MIFINWICYVENQLHEKSHIAKELIFIFDD